MNKVKKLTLIFFLALVAVALGVLPVVAANGDFTTYIFAFDDVVLGVGADETQRNVNWYSTEASAGEIHYAPAADMVSDSFPDEYKTAKATVKPAKVKKGYYVNSATITNLKENTEYVYRLCVGKKVSALYYFSTGSFGDYEFVVVADPQVANAAHSAMWSDTLNKISSNFENVGLVLSAGDQVNSTSSEIGTETAEEHWSHFFVDELTGFTVAPTAGPAHDIVPGDNTYSSYGERFFLPNLSDKYGVTASTANYWYVYNNTLFLNLNVTDGDAIKSEHKQFIMDAMRENPNVAWKVVFIHYPQYSVGDHSHPDNQYYEYATKSKRDALTPQFTELGIDLVISGHDHLYVRSKIMDGLAVSDDVVVDNTVTDPSGPVYITSGSASGNMCDKRSLSYEDAYYAEVINDAKRKSIVHFTVTDESLTLNAYFLDTDEPELFDTFTIYKTPHTHTPEKINAVEVTCTKDGNNEYWCCAGCERYFTDEECTRITTPEEETLSKLGHDWNDATCTSPKTCRNEGCTETQSKPKGHNAPDATCTENSVCKRCKETVQEALGHDYDNACDSTCNREDCDFEREVSAHTDSDANLLCDECGANIDPLDDEDDRNVGKVIIIIVACVGCAIAVGIAVTAIILVKKKRH